MTPITHAALSVDEADEFAAEEDHATRGDAQAELG
jgi:hypothetical protein